MGAKEAFCILLWSYQGGQINAKGLPIWTPGGRASGNCDEPGDCYRCPLMQQEIARHPPGTAHWVCPSCLREVAQVAKARNVKVVFTGHYTEGHCQYRGCTRPPRTELGDDGVPIEFPKGWSRFLQLVIGEIH